MSPTSSHDILFLRKKVWLREADIFFTVHSLRGMYDFSIFFFKNECKWGFANGSLALVDLRLQIINSTEVITDILGIRVENEETLHKEGREDPNYNKLMLKFKAKYLNKKTEQISPTVMSEPKVEKKVKKTSQEVETESWKVLPLQLRNAIVFRKELNKMKLFLVRSIGIWTVKRFQQKSEKFTLNLFLSQCLFTLRYLQTKQPKTNKGRSFFAQVLPDIFS